MMGALSSLPIVFCINGLLYAWVWLGVCLAVGLYRHWAMTLEVWQGLAIGFVASVVGAVTTFLLSSILGMAMYGRWSAVVGGPFTLLYVLPFPLVGSVAGLIAGVLLKR